MFSRFIILVNLLVVLRLSSQQDKVENIRDNQATDTGNATNCDPSNPKAEFNWSPLVLNPSSSVTVWIKHLTPQVSFNSGILRIEIWVPEGIDTPIQAFSYPLSCTYFSEEFSIKCPIKRNTPLPNGNYSMSLARFPTGNYSIRLELKNRAEETVFCFKFPIQIKEMQYERRLTEKIYGGRGHYLQGFSRYNASMRLMKRCTVRFGNIFFLL